MNPKQFENDQFVLYAPDSLNYITDGMEQILMDSFKTYKSLFQVNSFRKIEIHYFDQVEDFREFVYELRGERESLPEYARGTFDKGMIISCIPNNLKEGTPLYQKKRYNASHELFHIMYQELVWEKNHLPRIIWFDEGMAQFFSGEYQRELDDFEPFVVEVLSQTKMIPDLNQLFHGPLFETNEYSGYKLSLIAVKYLYDSIGMSGFQQLLYDENQIFEYGKMLTSELIEVCQEL